MFGFVLSMHEQSRGHELGWVVSKGRQSRRTEIRTDGSNRTCDSIEVAKYTHRLGGKIEEKRKKGTCHAGFICCGAWQMFEYHPFDDTHATCLHPHPQRHCSGNALDGVDTSAAVVTSGSKHSAAGNNHSNEIFFP